MILAQLFVYFVFYSFLGWVWETLYCTFREGAFQNRGFLFGPVCPIYGVSVVAVQLLFQLLESRIGIEQARRFPLWAVFLICAAGSAVMEYGTSWYLEKRFHARWWDYSDAPLNVNGRICLPVTLSFGAAGVGIVHFLLPVIVSGTGQVHPLLFEGLALVLAAVFGADFALTEASLNALLQRIESAERQFSEKAEAAYQVVSGTPGQIEAGIRSAQEEVAGRMRGLAESLSYREKNIMDNIRSFSPIRGVRYPARAGEWLKKALHEVRSLGPGRRKREEADLNASTPEECALPENREG